MTVITIFTACGSDYEVIMIHQPRDFVILMEKCLSSMGLSISWSKSLLIISFLAGTLNLYELQDTAKYKSLKMKSSSFLMPMAAKSKSKKESLLKFLSVQMRV